MVQYIGVSLHSFVQLEEATSDPYRPFPVSFDQFRNRMKAFLFVSEDIGPDRERLGFEWCYINI